MRDRTHRKPLHGEPLPPDTELSVEDAQGKLYLSSWRVLRCYRRSFLTCVTVSVTSICARRALGARQAAATHAVVACDLNPVLERYGPRCARLEKLPLST